MPSDNASPFDLNYELQGSITVPVVMKKNLVKLRTSPSQDSEGTLEVVTSLSQDAEGSSRVPNSSIFNEQFVVYHAAQCERGDPTAVRETLIVAALEAIWLKGLLLEFMPSAPDLV